MSTDPYINPLYMRVLGNRTGLVDSIYNLQMGRGTPDAFLSKPTTCDMSSLIGIDANVDLGIGGKGTSIEDSFHSSIGETIERYCLLWPDDADNLVKASYEEVCNLGTVPDFDYLDIASPTAREHHLSSLDRDTPIYWARGRNLLSGEETYVPAEHVWLEVGSLADTPTRFVGTTSGCAAGSTLLNALLGAIYEAVERDAFMQLWMRGASPDRLDLDACPKVRRFVEEHVDNESLSVEIVDYNSHLDIPTFGGITYNENDETPKFMIGGGASIDPTTAMIDAVVETIQGWPYATEMLLEHDGSEITKDDMSDNFEMNVLYYALPEHFEEVQHLLEGPEVDPDPLYSTPDNSADLSPEAELEYCLRRLDEADCTPIAFDLTTRDAKQLGITVSRVFIPELVPLTPPSLLPGRHPQLSDIDDVNEDPHPYP